jgi:hypothetical protein
MLSTFLLVHDKINHIQAFTVGWTVGTKAVRRMGFVINLHARGFIFMEGTAQAHMLVGFQAIPGQYLCHRQLLFYLLYFHVLKILQ